MAKQTINIGSGQNEGDGGPIRLAFEKINSNFDELYDGTVQTLTLVGTTLSISGGNQVTLDNVFEGGLTSDLNGSVFADDSTILVDAVNGTIPYNVLDGAPTALSDFTNDLDYAGIVGNTIALNGLPVDTFMTGDLDAQGNNVINANLVNATGDLTGSIFADDSTILVDAVNGTIPYPININPDTSAAYIWDGARPETVADALDRLTLYTQDFAVGTASDWSGTPPTTIIEAIDRLATVVKTLNAGTGA